MPAELWRGLEQNDLSHWPSGIYARAYVRQYAIAVGADPEAIVDEFCRSFAHGDRRAEHIVREHAAIVGHQLAWTDDLVGSVIGSERRANPAPSSETRLPAFSRRRRGRIVAAVADVLAVTTIGLAAAALLPIAKASALVAAALIYHAAALIAIGCTPAVWAIDTYLRSQHPSAVLTGPRFLRLTRRDGRLADG